MLSANTYLKQTTEARVFRRAYVVRNVVKGQRRQTVSDFARTAGGRLSGMQAFASVFHPADFIQEYTNIFPLCI